MVWGDKAGAVVDAPDELMKVLMKSYLSKN
jgi:hypothetical protein